MNTNDPLIIIIEGPDGAGKTTLAKRLASDLELIYHHEGPPPLEVPALVHYSRLLDRVRGQRAIFDRLALGERVYGPVLRGKDSLGAEGWRVFSRVAGAVAARHVVCLPPPTMSYGSWKERADVEMFTDPTVYFRTYASFAYFTRFYGLRAHDYVTEPYGEIRADLALTSLPVLSPGVVGSTHARTLLVGEQVGLPTYDDFDLPFISTTGSSAYLTRALDAAGFNELDVAFVNALDRNGQPWQLPKTNAVGQPWQCVIALGRVARDACIKAELSGPLCIYAPHPQFWKRFHHHSLNEYAAILRGERRWGR